MSKFEHNKDNVPAAFSKLINLYNDIPDTIGCMEHINKPKCDGGCGAWCCILQNPQLMYCEFLRSWRYVLKHWDIKDIKLLIEKALRNYLSKSVTKGCIFWDKDTKLCKQHKTRPLNCYLYGIFPKQEIDPRVERLRQQYKNTPMAIFKEQCDLVSTLNGEKVTKDDTDKWFKRLNDIEKSIGISADMINDESGGTYRTYHDHIMIELFADYQLENFSRVRQFGSQEEKESLIMTVSSRISQAMSLLNDSKDGEKSDS